MNLPTRPGKASLGTALGTAFWAALCALVWAASGTANAQQIKGRVMVLVDTSGSMTQHFSDPGSAGGDGDLFSLYSDMNVTNRNYYPGPILNGVPDGTNSHMYAAKKALSDVLSATGDLDFGLMRYAPAITCPSPVNCCLFTAPLCVNPGSGVYVDAGGRINWGGGCGLQTLDAATNKYIVSDGGQILVLPSATSHNQVSSWVDNVENFVAGGPNGFALNPELRAAGPTPIAGSIRTAINSWYKPLLTYNHNPANANCNPATDALCDPQIDCRPYVFVAMTDGADSCEGCSNSGGCGPDPSQQSNPSALARQLHDLNPLNPVLTYAIGVAVDPSIANDPAVVELNAIAAAGGTTNARFANNEAAIESAMGDIVASSVKVESCNSRDDNCNRQIDEGLGVYQECAPNSMCTGGPCDSGRCPCAIDGNCNRNFICAAGYCVPACSVGVGACVRSGVRKCVPGGSSRCCLDDGQPMCRPLVAGKPGAIICNNGLDNNCDGTIDSQQPECAVDGGAPLILPELCNGLDDDLDGIIDNHLVDVGKSCGLNLGQCKSGVTVCHNSMGQDVTQPGGVTDKGDKLVCLGATGPSPEICNGLDDDCDGITDGLTRSCYDGAIGTQDVGPCHGGAQRCAAAANSGVEMWGGCVGEMVPAAETCNGVDDNCDTQIDNVNGAGMACCPSGNCGVGICAAGTRQCSGGKLDCVGAVGPQAEICNGLDDDCNMKVDDLGNIGKACLALNGCPGKLSCDVPGKREICFTMQMNCVANGCGNDGRVGNACGAGVGLPGACMPGQYVCENNLVTCKGGVAPAPEACNCVDDDCNGKTDDGASCGNGLDCVACLCLKTCDPGIEFPCPGGYFCDKTDKHCHPEKRCTPACPDGQQCDVVSGTCVDLCAGINCPARYKCMNGACLPWGCAEGKVTCAVGERCDKTLDNCVPDRCHGVTCGPTEFCDPATGQCHCTCGGVHCSSGQTCRASDCTCVSTCAGVTCGEFQKCSPDTGKCVSDKCAFKTCIAPLACVNGECTSNPCDAVKCPEMHVCSYDSLTGNTNCDQLSVPLDKQDRVVGAGGGGLAIGCDLGGRGTRRQGQSGALVLLAFLGLIMICRRRVL